MPPDRAQAFRGAVLGSMADLARLDPLEAAGLVLERFPEDHASVVQSLQGQPEAQYRYLQAATQVQSLICATYRSCFSCSPVHTGHKLVS